MTTTESQRTELPLWTPCAVMFANNDYQVIKMDLPGVDRNSVRIATHGDVLEVTAVGRDRRFYWNYPLRYHAGEGQIQTIWCDGALEIDVPRQKASVPTMDGERLPKRASKALPAKKYRVVT
jgi:HSP20 family molecular chaperone IbpA